MRSPATGKPAEHGVSLGTTGEAVVTAQSTSAPRKPLIRLNSLPTLVQNSPVDLKQPPAEILSFIQSYMTPTETWEQKYLKSTHTRDDYANEGNKPEVAKGFLRTLSYNVLHPAGKSSARPEYVDWIKYRRERIRNEIESIQASVIALQEVDMITFDEDFGDYFRERGYDALVLRDDKDVEKVILNRLAPKRAGVSGDVNSSQADSITAGSVPVSLAQSAATAAVAADGTSNHWQHQLKHMTDALLWRRDELTLEWHSGNYLIAAFSMIHTLSSAPSLVKMPAASAATVPKSSQASSDAPSLEVPSTWPNLTTFRAIDKFKFSQACLASQQPLLWFASVHLKSDGAPPQAGLSLPRQIPPAVRVAEMQSRLQTLDSAQQFYLQAKRKFNLSAAPSLIHQLEHMPTFILGKMKIIHCRRWQSCAPFS
jgi:hypothetical protein